MRTLELAEASESLAVYARTLSEGPIIVTTQGKPVAALMPIEHADLETVALSTKPHFLALIEHSRARQQAKGGIASEEVRRRLTSPRPLPRKHQR